MRGISGGRTFGRSSRDGMARCRAGVALPLAALVLAGCSVKGLAVDALADALAGSGAVYASDPDPELVGQALPFALKTIEGLLAESPDHQGLRLAAASGFAQYAWGFVQLEAERVEAEGGSYERAEKLRERALALYLRARDHALHALELRQPGLRAGLDRRPDEAAAALGERDVALAYWAGASWGAAISLGKDRPALLADFGAVRALLERAMALDPDWGGGQLHEAFVSLEAVPAYLGGSLERARHHFERAVALAGGRRAGPYVAYAEHIAVQTQDRAAYVDMLERALAVDPDAVPEQRLANLLVHERAARLLAQVDDHFLDDAPPEEGAPENEAENDPENDPQSGEQP